ncbi:MAG: sugar ABC transporter permease [Firmicutes bacterium]|nr:sugar ABC transporter permease [Bacillota bacterium]
MRRVGSPKSRRALAPYCWVMPSVIVIVGVMGYAFAKGFSISLTKWNPFLNPTPVPVGLGNYVKLLSDPLFRHSVYVTVVFAAGSVGAEMLLGMAGALMVQKLRFLKGLVRTSMLIPMMLAPAIAGLIWKLFMDIDFGLLNYFLSLLGLPEIGWIADKTWVLPSVVLVDVWQWTPFVVLILLAGLQSLPPEPYEAAEIDGATRLQAFRYITLPLMKRVIVITLLFRTIFSLRAFDTIFLLARGGGPGQNALTLSMYLYERAYIPFHMGMAATASYIILIITLLITAVILGLTHGAGSTE